MSVFVCPHTDGLFHVGHRPAALSAGIIDRDVLRGQAQRADVHPNYFDKRSAALPARQSMHSGVTRLKERDVKMADVDGDSTDGYAKRVDTALREMIERRAEAARDEYEIRCLHAGFRFRIPPTDVEGKPIDPRIVGRTGTVLDIKPWPVTSRNGDLLEVVHAVEYDDAKGVNSRLSDRWMTVSTAGAQ